MKKNIFMSLFVTFIMVISCFAMPASAISDDYVLSTVYEYFEDGSYSVTTITEYSNLRANTKTASKTYTHKTSDNDVLWSYKITGTFSYTGSSSSCTSVSDSYTISNDNWHMSSHSCSKSGNTAYGTVTMKYKILGITTNTISKDLSLTCSATGTLS
ncbi:MAG: hypothetical protein IKI94_03355 [Ruminococcus sp.]|nr:hypothetical protein [Ruminococcus sp.]